MLEQLLLICGLAIETAIGFIFLMAGVDKLRHRVELAGVIDNYRLLPEAAAGPVAALLPFVELAAGFSLLVGEHRAAPVVGASLLLLFAAAIAVNVRRGRRDIDCGCGHSPLRHRLSWGLVVRNIAMAAALLLMAPPAGAAAGMTEHALGAVAGVMLFLLYLLFELLATVGTSPTSPIHE
jgi:hypothetical protein